jgi:hypothetical protein
MSVKSRCCAPIAIALMVSAMSPAHAGFFGPDSEPLTPAQINERMQQEPIHFSGGGKALEIRTKGAAIGGFIAGFILSSAMASGGSLSGNPAQMQDQMQARMDIAQQFNSNLQVAANRISAEAAGAAATEVARRGPLPLLAQTLNDALRARQAQLTEANADPRPALTLRLSQTEWKLEFEAFSSDYVLKTALTLELLDKAADKLHLRTVCQQEFPRKMPLDDWERDDHGAIADAAGQIAAGCHAQFIAALLPVAAEAGGDAETAGTDARQGDSRRETNDHPDQSTQPTTTEQ